MIKFDDKQLNNVVEQDGDKHFFIETWGCRMVLVKKISSKYCGY
ncbi:hypothetical protein [Clostridium botulinum]|nr:hypothetical protein [Clostridium botulinum]